MVLTVFIQSLLQYTLFWAGLTEWRSQPFSLQYSPRDATHTLAKQNVQ